MKISIIKNEQDYKDALKQIDHLLSMAVKLGTSEGEELDLWITLVESYERQHHVIDFPIDPIEAIKFTMERKGLTVKDLVPFIGATNRVYEILNKKRNLTLAMIKRLHHGLGISADSLLA